MARAGYIRIAHDIGASEPALELDAGRYLDAIGLFTLCLCYCDRQLTDGRVPARALRVIAPGVDCGAALAELERVGFMEATPDGWTIPHYLDWQRSRDEVETAVENARQAARARWDTAPGNANRNANRNADGNAKEKSIKKGEEHSSSATEDDDGFSDFWSAYPRQVAERDCRRVWRGLSADDRRDAVAAAGHLAAWRQASGTELKFVPYPAKFLSERLDDWREGVPDGLSSDVPPKMRTCECGIELTRHEDGRLYCVDHGLKE